ncbi:MAG: methyltransferase domain-containing protein [bacterium]|nr:methyltransferase domain-containing protein [bacterium]
MTWEDGKQRHLELSEAAAPKYDTLYEEANFATGSYMNYEIEIVKCASKLADRHDVALDLGCGTGRDAFVLGRRFRQVYGRDFSPAMVTEANANRLSRAAGNVSFEVGDVDDGLPQVADSSVDLVNSSFGMASFVDRPQDFFRTVRRVLKPRGIAIFSFYNRKALVNRLELGWRPALAARTTPEGRGLTVDFAGETFEISARAYEIRELKNMLESHFTIERLVTFPSLTALFPQELFESKEARSLCREVDDLLAENVQLAAGPYVIGVVRLAGKKQPKKRHVGYGRVLDLLSTHGIDPDTRLRLHDRVRNMEDVRRVLPETEDGQLIKSILVTIDPSDSETAGRHVLFGMPADRKLHFGKAAKLLGVPRSRLAMARAETVDRVTGFTVGALPPFGLPKSIAVVLDETVEGQTTVWCGTGKSTESMRLTLDELKQLSTASIADVSKPGDDPHLDALEGTQR